MSDETNVVVAPVVEAADPEIEALRARLVQADLRTAAVRAGMVDLEGIKLIDMATVKLTEKGDVADGAAVMKALRVAKPYLFGGSSSSVAQAPRADGPKEKSALTMNAEEWKAARAELMRRR